SAAWRCRVWTGRDGERITSSVPSRAQESTMPTFTTTAPITAVLAIPAGRIQLVAADQADTTVDIRPADPDKGRDVKLAGQTTAEYSDGTLRVTAPAANRILGSSGAVEVTIQLPAAASARPPPRASPPATATSASAAWTATARSAPSGATSRSPRPPAATSCCAPRRARSPSAPPPESPPASTPGPRSAGST